MNAPLPRFAQIEPVGECNLRCTMCPVTGRQDAPADGTPAFIAFDDFRAIVDQLPGLEELHLQGLGEPLMHPEFFRMVEHATARGIRVSTNSNLTLLTAARAEACVASGLEALHVSIDGASALTYESIRIGARLDRVLRNLGRLMEAKARAGAATPRVRMVTVAMRRNLDELPALVWLAHAHGVGTMFVQHLCHEYGETALPSQYRGMRDFVAAESLLGADAAAVDAAFAAARDLAARVGVDLRLPPLASDRRRPRAARAPGHAGCDWPWRGAYFSFAGDAMPCCMVSTPDRARLGNALHDGVAATWNGPAYAAFREALCSDRPPEVCASCAVYNRSF
jgi:MoaA/NifB/PqqE/SkfB family radical SAM enzyme